MHLHASTFLRFYRSHFFGYLVAVSIVLIAGCGGGPTNPNAGTESTPPAQSKSIAIVGPAPAPKPAPPSVNWPTYHGSFALDGVADVSFPDALAQAWQFDAGAAISSPPVALNDRIFFTNNKGAIFALDMNGKEIWTKAFTEPLGEGKEPRKVYIDAPLVIVDATLIAAAANGTVYALDVVTGDVRWQCETKLPILGSPSVADVVVDGAKQKRVFVIDESEGALLCIDFNTGKLLWTGKTVSRCDGSPAANGSVVAYGSCAAALHVFSSVDGKLLHETPLDDDSQVAGGVVLLGDSIYSGSRSGLFVHINAQTGEKIWINKDCEGESFSTPAINDEYVVYGPNDSVLYALDRKTGALKWKQKLDDTPNSAVIARDKVIVTAAGDLHMLRLADGSKVWSQQVSDFITAPSIAGALVLVGSEDGSLTAFRGKDAA